MGEIDLAGLVCAEVLVEHQRTVVHFGGKGHDEALLLLHHDVRQRKALVVVRGDLLRVASTDRRGIVALHRAAHMQYGARAKSVRAADDEVLVLPVGNGKGDLFALRQGDIGDGIQLPPGEITILDVDDFKCRGAGGAQAEGHRAAFDKVALVHGPVPEGDVHQGLPDRVQVLHVGPGHRNDAVRIVIGGEIRFICLIVEAEQVVSLRMHKVIRAHRIEGIPLRVHFQGRGKLVQADRGIGLDVRKRDGLRVRIHRHDAGAIPTHVRGIGHRIAARVHQMAVGGIQRQVRRPWPANGLRLQLVDSLQVNDGIGVGIAGPHGPLVAGLVDHAFLQRDIDGLIICAALRAHQAPADEIVIFSLAQVAVLRNVVRLAIDARLGAVGIAAFRGQRVGPGLHVAVDHLAVQGLLRRILDDIAAVQPPLGLQLDIALGHVGKVVGRGIERSVFIHLVPAHQGIELLAVGMAVQAIAAVVVLGKEVALPAFNVILAIQRAVFRRGGVAEEGEVGLHLFLGQVQRVAQIRGNVQAVVILRVQIVVNLAGIVVAHSVRFRLGDLHIVTGQRAVFRNALVVVVPEVGRRAGVVLLCV